MPLVEGLARRHDRRGAEHDDLVQAGSIGLLNAIERFDPKRGEEFVAFAVPTVEGEMKRHIRDRIGAVRLPRRLQEARGRLPGVRDELTASLGRAPTQDELAGGLGISAEDLASLERTTASAADQAAPEEDLADDLDASESRLLLAGAFQSLDDTDRRILYLRFVRELSRRDVADQLGFSQSALARRTNAALAKVRAELEGRPFKSAGTGDPGPRAEPEPKAPPEPKAQPEHSGRLMLRMPQSLHTELARAAEREEVSLNQFITNTLSAAMHWHTESEPPPQPPRWLSAAVLTNIVVVVIAGVIAVVLLIVALQQGW